MLPFLDETIHTFLPYKNVDKNLHDLAKLYQSYQHSKSCRKYKSWPYRYNFGRFFADRNMWQCY